MARFIPLIKHGEDGTQSYVFNVVGVEFQHGKTFMYRHFILNHVSPIIPFVYAGSFPYKCNDHLFVVDASGQCWVENHDGFFHHVSEDNLLSFLKRVKSSHTQSVCEILQRYEEDDCATIDLDIVDITSHQNY